MNVVEDLGAKVSYLALVVGTPVYDVDSAPVGVVEHVLADEQADIFHGVIVAAGPDRPHRFADREQIAGLYERGVVLSVPGAELHEPSEDPPARVTEAAAGGDPMQVGLRRAWEWLSRPR